MRSARANLQRNHVVCLAILFSCQGTDVRERGARLGAPHVRVKQNVSTFGEPIPSDAVLLISPERTAGLPDDGTADPTRCVPFVSTARERLQPLHHRPYSAIAAFAPPCTNRCARWAYSSFPGNMTRVGTQQNRGHPEAIPRFRTARMSTVKPARATEPQ